MIVVAVIRLRPEITTITTDAIEIVLTIIEAETKIETESVSKIDHEIEIMREKIAFEAAMIVETATTMISTIVEATATVDLAYPMINSNRLSLVVLIVLVVLILVPVALANEEMAVLWICALEIL